MVALQKKERQAMELQGFVLKVSIQGSTFHAQLLQKPDLLRPKWAKQF